jgi:hypothetical protein
MQRKRAALVRGSTGAHTQAKEACSGGCASHIEGFISRLCTRARVYMHDLSFSASSASSLDCSYAVRKAAFRVAPGTGRSSYCLVHTYQDSIWAAIWTAQLTGLVASTQVAKRGSGKSAAPSPQVIESSCQGLEPPATNARGWAWGA